MAISLVRPAISTQLREQPVISFRSGTIRRLIVGRMASDSSYKYSIAASTDGGSSNVVVFISFSSLSVFQPVWDETAGGVRGALRKAASCSAHGLWKGISPLRGRVPGSDR